MSELQLTISVLALWCIQASVLGGLLPEGDNNGYKYKRPSHSVFGPKSNEESSQHTYIGKSSDKFGSPTTNTYDFGVHNAIAYVPPIYNDFSNEKSFGGRPYGGYRSTNGYNGVRNYPRGGGVTSNFREFSDIFRNRYNADNDRPRPYNFQYAVRDPPSGNDYNQQESSDGNVVQGEYRVLLPDSRTQIVKYIADDLNGYNANVHYEGQEEFPRSGSGIGVDFTPQGYQFHEASEIPYQSTFGLQHYQGRSSYNGPNSFAGEYSDDGNVIFRNGGAGVAVGTGTHDQYLPPDSGYGK